MTIKVSQLDSSIQKQTFSFSIEGMKLNWQDHKVKILLGSAAILMGAAGITAATFFTAGAALPIILAISSALAATGVFATTLLLFSKPKIPENVKPHPPITQEPPSQPEQRNWRTTILTSFLFRDLYASNTNFRKGEYKQGIKNALVGSAKVAAVAAIAGSIVQLQADLTRGFCRGGGFNGLDGQARYIYDSCYRLDPRIGMVQHCMSTYGYTKFNDVSDFDFKPISLLTLLYSKLFCG